MNKKNALTIDASELMESGMSGNEIAAAMALLKRLAESGVIEKLNKLDKLDKLDVIEVKLEGIEACLYGTKDVNGNVIEPGLASDVRTIQRRLDGERDANGKLIRAGLDDIASDLQRVTTCLEGPPNNRYIKPATQGEKAKPNGACVLEILHLNSDAIASLRKDVTKLKP